VRAAIEDLGAVGVVARATICDLEGGYTALDAAERIA
jgi:hypothetical protein